MTLLMLQNELQYCWYGNKYGTAFGEGKWISQSLDTSSQMPPVVHRIPGHLQCYCSFLFPNYAFCLR